jgi:hypothetical protein
MAGRRLETRTDWILPPPTAAIIGAILLHVDTRAARAPPPSHRIPTTLQSHLPAGDLDVGIYNPRASASRYYRGSAGG